MALPSVAPALLAATVDAAVEALPDVELSYGKAVSDGPGDYLMLLVDDPDDDWQESVTSERDWAGVGIDADVSESGDIACTALSWNGDGNMQAAVEAVYANIEALVSLIRALPNLGLIQVSWTLPGRDLNCETYQADDGAKARLKFSIHFQALI